MNAFMIIHSWVTDYPLCTRVHLNCYQSEIPVSNMKNVIGGWGKKSKHNLIVAAQEILLCKDSCGLGEKYLKIFCDPN